MQNNRLDKVQNLAFSATPVTSAPFGPQTYRVRIATTTSCNISIGAAVNAFLPAGVAPETITVSPGQTITVVQVAAAGTLNIVELA